MAGITNEAAVQFATAMATEQQLEAEDRRLLQELSDAKAALAERKRRAAAVRLQAEEAERDTAAVVAGLQRVQAHIGQHWEQLVLLNERRKNVAAQARAVQASSASEEGAVRGAQEALTLAHRDADVARQAGAETRRRALQLQQRRETGQRSLGDVRRTARRVDAAAGKVETASALVKRIMDDTDAAPGLDDGA